VDTQDLHIGDIDDSSGDNKRTYDSATVDQCKAKCAKYAKCDGFNYEIHSLTCYYKTGVSTSLPRSSTVHDCYVYMRPTVTSATRARTTATPTTTVLKTRATLFYCPRLLRVHASNGDKPSGNTGPHNCGANDNSSHDARHSTIPHDCKAEDDRQAHHVSYHTKGTKAHDGTEDCRPHAPS